MIDLEKAPLSEFSFDDLKAYGLNMTLNELTRGTPLSKIVGSLLALSLQWQLAKKEKEGK